MSANARHVRCVTAVVVTGESFSTRVLYPVAAAATARNLSLASPNECYSVSVQKSNIFFCKNRNGEMRFKKKKWYKFGLSLHMDKSVCCISIILIIKFAAQIISQDRAIIFFKFFMNFLKSNQPIIAYNPSTTFVILKNSITFHVRFSLPQINY